MTKIAIALAGLLSLGLPSLAHSQDKNTILIGAAAPLSGPQAIFGKGLTNGMQLYFDQLNAAGGLPGGHKIELVTADDRADPREGVLVAQKFCDNDQILAVLAHFNSGITIPSLDVYGGCSLPQVTVSSNPKVTQLGFQHVFRAANDDYAQAQLSASYAIETLKEKKAAIIQDKQAFGEGVAKIFSDKFKALGGEVTSVSGVNSTDVDFGPVITSLKAENQDMVYVGAVMPQLALIVRQMREQGIKASYFVPDGGYTPDFFAQAGKDNAEGALVTFQVPPYDSKPELIAFAKAYKDRFGKEPDTYDAYGYLSAWIVGETLKKMPEGEVNRENLIKALHGTNLKGSLLGIDVAFTDNGDLKNGLAFLYQATDGKFKLIK
jgi:branched-chain amino acid transport system substrate-binding protein